MGEEDKLNKKNRRQKKGSSVRMRKPRKQTWSLREQIDYLQFLKMNSHLMSSKASRKVNKIFKKMAEAVKTRTTIQAKSHHQKMGYRFKNLSGIIRQVSNQIHERLMKQNLQNSREVQAQKIAKQTVNNRTFTSDQELAVKEDDLKTQENERLLLASYCSFFDEYSQHYGKIESGVIMNDYQWLF